MMNPGRELDVLIAEHIFGAKIIETYKASGYTYLITDKRINHPCCVAMENRYDSRDFQDVPNFSTDIRIAWEVINHLHLHSDIYVEIIMYNRRNGMGTTWGNDHGYKVTIGQAACQGMAGPPYVESSNSLPLAICLAALKVVGIKNE